MYITETQRVLQGLSLSAPMTWAQIVGEEIGLFVESEAYQTAVEAERYYRNRSGVQNKTVRFKRRSNVKNEQPILRKLVDQKISYLLTKPFSVDCNDKGYAGALSNTFDSRFRKKMKSFGRCAPKYGIGWMQPYIDDGGKLDFKVYPFTQIIPLWKDAAHSELDGFIHFFEQTVYVAARKTTLTRAELWDTEGVRYFLREQGQKWKDDPDYSGVQPHFTIDGKPHTWEKPPLVWAKYNEEELPLFYFLRELIDSFNWNMSVTDDVLRDIANFIYILKNYGGTDLAEFIRDLHESLAVKVNDDGGVDKLQADLNIDAVMRFLDDVRRKIFDFGAGVDTKDPDLGNASGRAIGFRYMDLDNDCQNLAMELQESFEKLKFFLDVYFELTGRGSFSEKTFSITFNMDMPVNEAEIMNTLYQGGLRLSNETLIGQVPWISDVGAELERLEKEKQQAVDDYRGTFPSADGVDDEE